VTYFAVVSTTAADTQGLVDQTNTATTQAVKLRREIGDLKAAKKNEAKIRATRDAYRKALPSGSGVPAFLRQLQAQGTDVGVDVSGLTVGVPEEIEGTAGVWSIPIQLIADGTAAKLDDFLEVLQGSSQKRAVLIESGNLSSDSDTAGAMRLELTVRAFVAPPVGSGAPSVTTD
jgi:Tfp pilus assembly protein PilO